MHVPCALVCVNICMYGYPAALCTHHDVSCLTSAIDYIQYLKDQKKKQEDGLEALRKEVMALKIMKA